MTDIDKKIKWQIHIRLSLREADDIDAKLQELLNKFKADDLQKAIIDIYINVKEKRLGTYSKQSKDNYYIQFSNEQNQNNYDKLAFEGLKNKYIDEHM